MVEQLPVQQSEDELTQQEASAVPEEIQLDAETTQGLVQLDRISKLLLQPSQREEKDEDGFNDNQMNSITEQKPPIQETLRQHAEAIKRTQLEVKALKEALSPSQSSVREKIGKMIRFGTPTPHERTILEKIESHPTVLAQQQGEVALFIDSECLTIQNVLTSLESQFAVYEGNEEVSPEQLQMLRISLETVREGLDQAERELVKVREICDATEQRELRVFSTVIHDRYYRYFDLIQDFKKKSQELQTMYESGLGSFIETGIRFISAVGQKVEQTSGDLMLTPLQLVPSEAQLEIAKSAYANFNELVKANHTLLVKYLTDNKKEGIYILPDQRVPRIDQMLEGRLKYYLQLMIDLQAATLVHQLPIEKVQRVLDDGALRSSQEILARTGENVAESAVGKKMGGLPYVTLAINGAESAYGKSGEARNNSGESESIRGAIFMLPVEALAGNPFFLVGRSSANPGTPQYDQEAHVYPKNFKSKANDAVEVGLSLEGATLYLPEDAPEVTIPAELGITVVRYGRTKDINNLMDDDLLERRRQMNKEGVPIRIGVVPYRREGEIQTASIRMQTNTKPLFRLQRLESPVHLAKNPNVIELLGQRRPIIPVRSQL